MRAGTWPASTASFPPDINRDGLATVNDVNAFVLACSGQTAYEAVYPFCNWLTADCNSEGTVNTGDINCFIVIISQPDSRAMREYTWDGKNRLVKAGAGGDRGRTCPEARVRA
jgi:hypothetical protein